MSERYTANDCRVQFERARNAAHALGIDTDRWDFHAGSGSMGTGYKLLGAGIGWFSNIGRTAREAHTVLSSLAFAWEKALEARSRALAGRHVQVVLGEGDEQQLADLSTPVDLIGTIEGVPIPVSFVRPVDGDQAPACDCGRAPNQAHRASCALIRWEQGRLATS